MLEIIGFLTVSIVVVSVATIMWMKIQGAVYPSPSIYLVPQEGVFILSQGQYRVVFDALTLVGHGWMTFDDINTLVIGKYSPLDPSKTYLALDRNKKFVAAVPIDMERHSRVAVFAPGNDKPEWMNISKFEEKQHDMLAKHPR